MHSMMRIKKSVSVIIICAFVVSGCATGGTGASNFNVGPGVSSSVSNGKIAKKPDAQRPKLDIIVPVFDPGLPADAAKYAEKGIWPELRRAESSRFAYKMKQALENTEAFGAVRVMPDKTATGDLYVIGKIEESDGVNVEIAIKVYDIGGKLWLKKTFAHEVEKDFYRNIRNKGKDAYDPVFKKAADRIAKILAGRAAEDLAKLQALTNLRFAANFSEEAFAQHMQVRRGVVSLASYPDENDVMLKRVQAIRIRDQLFTDKMQPHYEEFSHKMDDSYAVWQKQSFTELEAERQAKVDTAKNAIAGVALIGLAVFAAIAGVQSNTSAGQSAGTAASVVSGMAGAKLLEKSFQINEEAKFHREALAELGESIDSEMAPKVVKFEQSTLKLTGSAKEQFAQWRTFLKKIYAQEATPDVQL
ncbi:MAG: hypothetical protein R8K53_06330 [Mariprofundaceae bacterium]